MYSPFLRLDDPRPAEILTDATVTVLLDRGVDGFSVGALARYMNVTPAAVLKSASRAQVIEMVVRCFGRRWVEWAGCGGREGLPAALPGSDEEMHGVRVYHALAELCRGERSAGRTVAEEMLLGWRDDEIDDLRASVTRMLGRVPTDLAVRELFALVTGLRLALAQPQPVLDREEAVRLLLHRTAEMPGEPVLSRLRTTPPSEVGNR